MLRIAGSIVGLVLVLLGPGVFAEDLSVQGEIQARYDQFGAAIDEKDWAALRMIYSPDYRSVDTEGKSATVEMEISGLQQAPHLPDKKVKTTIVSLRLANDMAYVEQRVDESFSKSDPTGKRHAFVLVAHSSDIWRRSDSKWVIVETATNDIDLSVDGVVVSHKNR